MCESGGDHCTECCEVNGWLCESCGVCVEAEGTELCEYCGECFGSVDKSEDEKADKM